MSSLFAILLLVSLCGFLIILSKRTFEEVIPLSIFITILILYFFGLFGFLKSGIYVVCISAFCSIGFSAFYIITKRDSSFIKRFFTPGFVIFWIITAIIYCGTKGLMITRNDEFSHWGLVVKNMVIFDAFGYIKGGTTMFPSYPPGISLLQYFFIRLDSGFHEASLYQALDIMAVSTFMPLFKSIPLKKWKHLFIITLIIFTLPLIFYSDFYHSIYVDGILGVLFAYILFSYFSENTLTKFNILNISLASAVLTLLKGSGFGLALIANVIIWIDVIFPKKKKSNYNYQQKIKLSCASVSTLLILCSELSWNIFLKYTNTPIDWDLSVINFSEVLGLITSNTADSHKAAFQNVTRLLFDFQNGYAYQGQGNYAIKMSCFMWIGIYILIGFIIFRTQKNEFEKRRIKFIIISLICGFLLYTASIYILYCIIFPETEGITGTSFYRYINSYLSGGLIFLILLLIVKTETQNPEKSRFLLICILGVSMAFVPYYEVMRFSPIISDAEFKAVREMRSQYAASGRFSKIMDSDDDKVFVINLTDNGLTHLIVQYNATPIPVQSLFSRNIMEINKENGKLIWNITPNEWSQRLMAEYTYIYLHDIDNNFEEIYKRLFNDPNSIQDNSLYRIDKTGDEVRFVYVEN